MFFHLMRVTDKYVLFCKGPLGNWYKTPMTKVTTNSEYGYHEVNGLHGFDINFFSSEQLFMWHKAVLFHDAETANKIVHCTTSKEAKALGREVAPFDQEKWDRFKEILMECTLWTKFEQSEEFRSTLMNPEYYGKEFVECNHEDRIWAIGRSEEDSLCDDMSTWRGTNLLGKILTKMRDSKLAK